MSAATRSEIRKQLVAELQKGSTRALLEWLHVDEIEEREQSSTGWLYSTELDGDSSFNRGIPRRIGVSAAVDCGAPLR